MALVLPYSKLPNKRVEPNNNLGGKLLENCFPLLIDEKTVEMGYLFSFV